MKTSRYIIPPLAVMLFLGCVLWLVWPPRAIRQSVTLSRQTNSGVESSNAVAFCLTNMGPRAILLTDIIVEARLPNGWQAFSHTVPTHPQRLALGDTKDLVAGAPGRVDPWRLRIVYGTDVKGPRLSLAKAEYAITHLRLTGPGFGVMAGSNSCVSAEISVR